MRHQPWQILRTPRAVPSGEDAPEQRSDQVGLHPWKGETEINYTGPKPPYDNLNFDQAYSFLKTPRWKGNAMEVGPLARMLVGYARGREDFKEVVDSALSALGVPATALFSTLGRTAARGLETQLIIQWAMEFYEQLLTNIRNGNTRMDINLSENHF